MIIMTRILPFFIAAIVLFACGTTQQINPNQLIVTTIQTGNLYGAGDEVFKQSVRVIHSIEEWHNLVKELGKVNVFETDFDPHTFDFEHKRLFFCTDSVRNSGGYSLSVSNGVVMNNKTIVHVNIQSPQGTVAEVITQPYILFSMNKKGEIEVLFK